MTNLSGLLAEASWLSNMRPKAQPFTITVAFAELLHLVSSVTCTASIVLEQIH